MSFESGKKLGLIASIFNIIVPPIMVIAVFTLYASVLNSLLTSISGTETATTSSIGFLIAVLGIVIVGVVLAVVGYILFLIGMHRLSQYYNEPVIFKNLLKALIIQIIFAVVAVVFVFAFFFISSVSISTASTTTTAPSFALSILGVYAVALIISLVVSIYCALLYKRSFDKLAEKSQVDTFKTTGLLYLIGTLLTIVGIGSIIIWIAWIFAAMGYHKMTPTAPATAPFTYSPYPAQAPLTGQTKRCPNCGAENSPDAIYCQSCGRPLQ